MQITLSSLSNALGGVELRMALEARLLKREGHPATVALNLHQGLVKWAQGLRAEGIPVIHYDPEPIFEDWWWLRKHPVFEKGVIRRFKLQHKFWKTFRPINKRIARRQASALYERTRPDLVHISIPWSGFEATRLYLAHCRRLPIALVVHNAFPKFQWSPWHRRHYRESFESVRGVYAVSRSALDHFVDLYGEFIRPGTVLRAIPNSVDTDRYQPDASKRVATRRRLGIPESSPVVGFVGRIEKQKRPLSVIDAFAQLHRLHPDARLVMVGSGPLERPVKERVRDLGLEGRVLFAGWRSNVEDYLPAFDVVLQLSNNEGFGTATAEAMACGVPVVGTDVPGTRDILGAGRGGILVPLNDEGAAAKACSHLLENRQLHRRFCEEARREAHERYRESAWELNILSFYEEAFPGFHRASGRRGTALESAIRV
jgi:glycosyltransferase involved in cell wall biosynthesis